MPEMIKVVVQKPGENSQISEIVNDTETMNSITGGLSTVITIPENGLKLVINACKCNKDLNLRTLWGEIYGNVIITAMNNGKHISLTAEQCQSARAWLLKHSI